jgi:hypothetical protein
LIKRYTELRQLDVKKEGDSYTTTRSLLALIRLCQARVIIYLIVGSFKIFKLSKCQWRDVVRVDNVRKSEEHFWKWRKKAQAR